MAWLTMSPCHRWQGLIVSRPIFPLTWRHAGPADGAPPIRFIFYITFSVNLVTN